MSEFKITMEYKHYSQDAPIVSFKWEHSGEASKRVKNFHCVWQALPSSSKQVQGRNNRKVVFITSGERPFKLSEERFSAPIRYSLIKSNTNSQYPVRIVDDSEDFMHFLDGRKHEYLHLLATTDFFNGETEELETMTAEMIKKKKSVFLNWIQQLFLENIDVPDIEVAILNLLRLYTYDELAPASQMIALAARDMAEDRVKDAAFSLFGHWGDVRALKLLEAYGIPSDPWMAVKYETLINDIKKYDIR